MSQVPRVAWERLTLRGRGVLGPELDVEQPAIATRSIVIASSERTGSTLVNESLRRTGVAGVPAEYFNAEVIGEAFELLGVPRLPVQIRVRRQLRRARLRSDWAATWDVVPGSVGAYLDHLVRHRTSANGVFTTKLHWNQHEAMTRAGLSVDAFPQPVSWVHVMRNDRLAQAVSLARARQSGQWSATQVVRRRRPYEPWFDAAAISTALAEVVESAAGWDGFFARSGITPIRVAYEDLVADYPGTMTSLFDRLGLDVSVEPEPPTQRQADAISASWVERYAALYPRPGT
jgi:LPS sulfotransferase NodH